MIHVRKGGLLGQANRDFYTTLIKISLPIVMQRLLNALLFMLDNVMVGGLGENTVAAVGMANKLTYLMNVFCFGIMSATSIFAGQYWGKRDIASMRRVQGISHSLLIAVAGTFTLVGLVFPTQVMSIWSSTPEVIATGADYLRIVSLGYLFQVTSQNYATILKSCEMTVLPLVSSIIAMVANFVINFTLINGYFGFPALGAVGSAIGTTISLVLDCGIVLGYTYLKKTPAAAKLRELRYKAGELRAYLKESWPVLTNECLWSVGVITYQFFYSRLGDGAMAAVQMFEIMDRIFYSLVTGLGAAGAVMVGNKVGAGLNDTAFNYGKKLLRMDLVLAAIMPFFILALAPVIFGFFAVSDGVMLMARQMVYVMCVNFAFDSLAYTLVISTLRAGGDAEYAMKMDLTGMWAISVPLCFLAAIVFKLPLWACYAGVVAGNVFKTIVLYRRFRTGKWTRDITQSLGSIQTESTIVTPIAEAV